jgi:metal-responsive CopG/Arc/MetJ family transcriptional regulator
MATEFQMVRVDIDLLDRIDDIKDEMVPRDPFIRKLLEQAVEQIENRQRAARKRKVKPKK